MRKIEIEIPDGYKEVVKRTENSVVIEWVKEDKEQEMRDFLKPFLTNLLLVMDEENPDSVFYKQNRQIIFQLKKYEGKLYFWVDYNRIWSIFSNIFGLTYDETQSFIKTVVEDTLNLRGITPKSYTTIGNTWEDMLYHRFTDPVNLMWDCGKQG